MSTCQPDRTFDHVHPCAVEKVDDCILELSWACRAPADDGSVQGARLPSCEVRGKMEQTLGMEWGTRQPGPKPYVSESVCDVWW